MQFETLAREHRRKGPGADAGFKAYLQFNRDADIGYTIKKRL